MLKLAHWVGVPEIQTLVAQATRQGVLASADAGRVINQLSSESSLDDLRLLSNVISSLKIFLLGAGRAGPDAARHEPPRCERHPDPSSRGTGVPRSQETATS